MGLRRYAWEASSQAGGRERKAQWENNFWRNEESIYLEEHLKALGLGIKRVAAAKTWRQGTSEHDEIELFK